MSTGDRVSLPSLVTTYCSISQLLAAPLIAVEPMERESIRPGSQAEWCALDENHLALARDSHTHTHSLDHSLNQSVHSLCDRLFQMLDAINRPPKVG